MHRVFALLASAILGFASSPRLALAADSWPDLASIPSVSGRAATKDDVAAGRAAFFPEKNGKSIGTPMRISVPQYAYHIDAASKTRRACVVIQAEEANGLKVLGCRFVEDNSILACLLNEFELLGTKRPASPPNKSLERARGR